MDTLQRNRLVLAGVVAAIVLLFGVVAWNVLRPAPRGGGESSASSSLVSSAESVSSEFGGEFSSVSSSFESSSVSEAASSAAASSAIVSSGSGMTGPTPGLTPSHTVVEFYQGVIVHRGNPLLDGYYRSNPSLTGNFLLGFDAAQESAYNPVFCSAAKPPAFAVTATARSGDTATVSIAEQYASGQINVQVSLRRDGDVWKIDQVRCPASAQASS